MKKKPDWVTEPCEKAPAGRGPAPMNDLVDYLETTIESEGILDNPVLHTFEAGEHKRVEVRFAWTLNFRHGDRNAYYYKCVDCETSHFALEGFGCNLDSVSCPPPAGYFDPK